MKRQSGQRLRVRNLLTVAAVTVGCGGSTGGAVCGEGTVEDDGVCVARDAAVDSAETDTFAATDVTDADVEADGRMATDTAVATDVADAVDAADRCKDPLHVDCVACSSELCYLPETYGCTREAAVPPLVKPGDHWSIRLKGTPPGCPNCIPSALYPAYLFGGATSTSITWRVKVTAPWFVAESAGPSPYGTCAKTRQRCVVLRRETTLPNVRAIVFMDTLDAGASAVDVDFEAVTTDATCP